MPAERKRSQNIRAENSLNSPRKRSLVIFVTIMSLEWVGAGSQPFPLGYECSIMGFTDLGAEYHLFFPNRNFDLTGISFLELSIQE